MDPERLSIPESATDAEAAAIAVAIEAYLEETAAQAEDDSERDSWQGRRWRFRGRLEGLGRESSRVPRDAPTESWRAASRTDRF